MPVSSAKQNMAFPIRQSATRATKLIAKMTTTATDTKLQGFNDNYTDRFGFYSFKSLQAKHADRAIPDRPITQEEEAKYLWLVAFHKAAGGCTAVSRDFMSEFPRRNAFVFSLDRGVRKKTTSGVTVSTKFPLRLQLAIEALQTPIDGSDFLNPPDFLKFTWQRFLDIWLEHERIVAVSPNGMRVML
jgi:hypothetical protein